MPTHMTHERIVRSYLGEEVLWLVSRGVNHGKVGSFVWGLSLETFRSRGYWSATSSDIDDEQVAQQYLLDACGVMEWQGRLLVPCGKHGLWQVRLRKKRTNFHNDPMLPVHLTTLASVRELRLVSGSNTDGVFAIGEDESGMLVQEWVSRGLVESAG